MQNDKHTAMATIASASIASDASGQMTIANAMIAASPRRTETSTTVAPIISTKKRHSDTKTIRTESARLTCSSVTNSSQIGMLNIDIHCHQDVTVLAMAAATSFPRSASDEPTIAETT